MINYARQYNLNGIYTIVSRAMLTILKRSGWQVRVLKEAYLSEEERIYLLYLPTDSDSQAKMATKINAFEGCSLPEFEHWPMSVAVIKTALV